MTRMLSGLLTFFILANAFGQKNTGDYLLLRFDTSYYDNYAYLDKKGDTVIAAGKYRMCYTDTFYNTAIVYSESEGLVMINRNEDILLHVFPYDNGPDYVSEGLFRIIEDDLIGYADTEGNVIIEPIFECAFPFTGGYATICTGGILINDGEHSWWKEARWGTINKKGEVVIRPKYDNYFEFHDGKAVVELNNEIFEIDTIGNRLK